MRIESLDWSFLAFRMALVKSLRRGVKRGVHQGFDLEERQERGVKISIVKVRVARAEKNQRSSCLGKGVFGVGGDLPGI